MKEYVDKSALVAEIEKCYNESLKRAKITDSDYWNAKADAYRNVLAILNDTLEVKEVDNIWHTESEFSNVEPNRSVLLIENDGRTNLLKSPSAERLFWYRTTNLKMWAYVDELLNISNVQVKEVDLEKEISNYLDNHNLNIQDGGRIVFNNGDTPNFLCDFRDIAKHFFELGLKSKGE